jgi:nicotinamidase-related amidase
MPEKPLRLRRSRAGLVVVDIQERLLPAMFEKERVLRNAIRLMQGAAILGVPVFATEQYPKGLGASVPEIANGVAGTPFFPKTTFSALGAEGFTEALRARQVSQAILCGLEAHVCVSQTCLDFLEQGLEVFVAADAVSSRTPENMQYGLQRMREAGAIIVSTEMALFELLEKAGTEEFKKVQAWIKQDQPGGLKNSSRGEARPP